jgi:signal transduction histidine kinase/CheY-like chemotaxis protein
MSSLLALFVRELGYALFEAHGNGKFTTLSEAPGWLPDLWPGISATGDAVDLAEKSAFLENFLDEARAFWDSGLGGECRSETWIEATTDGREAPLQAVALHVGAKAILALHSPDVQFREQVRTLQTARNSLLDHERLLREIQKKEILLHCIVHDLSQPLSVMHVALDCLNEEGLDEKRKKFIELGKSASEQQESMIREVLQIFSADLGATLDADKSASGAPDLRKSADSVMTSLGLAFEAKNVRLTLEPSESANGSWLVRGEESRLRRIFSNLLENALRYSPGGSQVSITLEDQGDFCQANVDDQGPGLPPDLRPTQIFGLFSKGKQGGGKAGLGMYFCRITVERWGGSIGCASLPRKGARFWFRLPRAAATTEQRKQTAASKPPAAAPLRAIPVEQKALRILLADDQEDIRVLTTHQLERYGHKVTAVANGKEASEAVSGTEFDVVLLDEQMPIVGGVETARKIHEAAANLPRRPFLIALTGNGTDEDRERLLSEGFDFVLAKPFRLSALNGLLGLPANTDPPAAPFLSHPTQPLAAATLPVGLLERVGGDEKLLRQMIRTFLKDTPKRVSALQQQIRRKNSHQVASLAHAIHGSAAIFGSPEAGTLARQLQNLGRDSDFLRATQVYVLLKEEIAKLEQNLRVYLRRERSSGSSTSLKSRQVAPKRSR